MGGGGAKNFKNVSQICLYSFLLGFYESDTYSGGGGMYMIIFFDKIHERGLPRQKSIPDGLELSCCCHI